MADSATFAAAPSAIPDDPFGGVRHHGPRRIASLRIEHQRLLLEAKTDQRWQVRDRQTRLGLLVGAEQELHGIRRHVGSAIRHAVPRQRQGCRSDRKSVV